MSIYVVLYFTSTLYIALRAFQQLNVMHERFMWVPIVTAGMAVMEVLTVTSVVSSGSLLAAIPLALGGVTGTWSSMWLHKYLRRRKHAITETA